MCCHYSYENEILQIDDLSFLLTVMRIIKLKIFPVPVRLHSGYGILIFVIISPFFAIIKSAVHSLEPGETPSDSASHQAPKYAQRSSIYQNILKRLRLGWAETWRESMSLGCG